MAILWLVIMHEGSKEVQSFASNLSVLPLSFARFHIFMKQFLAIIALIHLKVLLLEEVQYILVYLLLGFAVKEGLVRNLFSQSFDSQAFKLSR